MIWIFDVDGVLADFTRSFTKLAHERYGTRVYSGGQQPNWHFSGENGLLTSEQETALWQEIKGSNMFWMTVLPCVSPGEIHDMQDLARELNKGDDLIYLTSRVGKHPGRQTESWLKGNGFPEGEVIINNAKRDFIQSNYLGHRVRIIEDRPDTIVELQDAGIWTATRDWQYNRHVEADHRVSSVSEFIGAAATD